MINKTKNFWQGSLRNRLLGYVLLLTLMTTFSVSGLTYVLSRGALADAVTNRLETAATLKEAELNRWIKNREQEISLLAQEPALHIQAEILLTNENTDPFYSPSYRGLSAYLQNMVSTNTNFAEIFILTNIGGKTVFSTNSIAEGEYHVTAPYFTEGRKGLFTQNIYPSLDTSLPLMTIATPISNQNGETIGVLAAHLNMKKLDEIILEQAGLGKSGETYLVDQYGNFVTRAKFGSKQFPRGVHTYGINTAIAGENGAALYTNYNETPVAGVYKWIPSREIALLAEISQKEAFAPARQLALTTLFIGLGATVIASFLTYFLAQQITKPILAIVTTAKEIQKGNLEEKAPIITRDEVGILAETFNNLSTQTKELIDTLEEKVADRTRDIAVRSAYLEGAAQVAQIATTITDAEELSKQVVNLIQKQFDLYYVGLFLLDEDKEFAVLNAGTGEAGQTMLANNHRLRVGEGMIGWAVRYGEARIALDVGEDAVRFDNPVLPETRTEGALPLRSRGRVLGALSVQSTLPKAFTPEIITTLQTMADQIAIAFDNAELIAENKAALEAERRAYGEQSYRSWQALKQASQIASYKMTSSGNLQTTTKSQNGTAMEEILNTDMIKEDGDTAVLPIRVRKNIIGGIRIKKPESQKKWTKEQLALAKNLAEQLSVALESARLFNQTQLKAQREAIISDISAKISASIRMERIIETTVRELGDALNATEIDFQLTNTDPTPKRPKAESDLGA